MFKKNDIINNKFEVLFSIQTTTFGSSYRVKGIEDGKIYMLKVYEKEKLNDWHFNEKGDLIEAEIHQQIDHPNISKFVACELISFQEQDLYIYVVEFISGETLQERIDREGNPNPSFATNMMKKIMSAVSYLHSFDSPIIHSDITPLNIMLDMSSGTLEPVLIDFGLSKYKQYSTFYNSSIPSIFYCAPEQFSGEYSIKSDIFSLGALYYMLMEGYFPWHNKFNISDINSVDLQEKIINNRNSKLTFTAINAIEETIKLSIVKSLLPNASSRFESVDDFYKSIKPMIWHLEGPIGGLMNCALRYVMEAAYASGVKVLLDGTGPDEAFGGYQNHHNLYIAELLERGDKNAREHIQNYSKSAHIHVGIVGILIN